MRIVVFHSILVNVFKIGDVSRRLMRVVRNLEKSKRKDDAACNVKISFGTLCFCESH